MKITPVPHGLDDLVGKSTAPRSPGLHMSQIYGSLYEELEPRRFTGGTPDPLRLEAGLALERILEDGLKRRLVERPGEFVSPEGIIFSPDLIIFNGCERVGEMKLTWLSTRGLPREPANSFPPKFDKYFTQMMAYCHCLGTPYAQLIGFFVMGDYKYYKDASGDSKPCGPQLLAWDITFTARELQENWQMLMVHARGRGML